MRPQPPNSPEQVDLWSIHGPISLAKSSIKVSAWEYNWAQKGIAIRGRMDTLMKQLVRLVKESEYNGSKGLVIGERWNNRFAYASCAYRYDQRHTYAGFIFGFDRFVFRPDTRAYGAHVFRRFRHWTENEWPKQCPPIALLNQPTTSICTTNHRGSMIGARIGLVRRDE